MCCAFVALLEKTRAELESNIAKLRQKIDVISEQSEQTERELKLALNNERLAHETDVDRLTADKVLLHHESKSQGSVLGRLTIICCKFSTGSVSDRTFKIDQYLAKIWIRV